MSTSPLTSSPSASTAEVWRSKLGTNYDKEYMQKNEHKLLKELQHLRDLPENRICADCGDEHGTVWASVNLGVFLCMTCGSHHRSLGTHISLPKGCTGSYWWGPDEIERMKSIGNARAKELYGDTRPNGLTKDDAFRWKEYLTDKYVHKKYAPSHHKAPLSPRFSPKTKKVSTHQAVPNDLGDLIHFDSPTSPKAVIQTTHDKMPETPETTGSTPEKPATGDDFFAQFGL